MHYPFSFGARSYGWLYLFIYLHILSTWKEGHAKSRGFHVYPREAMQCLTTLFFICTFFGRLDVLLPPISYYVLCVDAFVLGHVGTHVILRSDRNREPASCRRDCNGTRGIVI